MMVAQRRLGSLAPVLAPSPRLTPTRWPMKTVTSRRVTSADGGMADSSAVIARVSILTLDMNFMHV
jgi:hypothetical protein